MTRSWSVLAVLLGMTLCSLSLAADELTIDTPQRAVLVFTNGKQFAGELQSLNSKEVKFKIGGRGTPITYKANQLKEVQIATDTYVYNKDKARFESLKAARDKDNENEPEGAITIDTAQPAFFLFANGQILPGQLISLNSKEVRCTIGNKTASFAAGKQIKVVRVRGKNLLPEDLVYNDDKGMFENAREKVGDFGKDATFPQQPAVGPPPPMPVVPNPNPNPNPNIRPRPRPVFPQPQPQPVFPQPQPQPAFPQPQPQPFPQPVFPVTQPQPTPPFQPQPIQPSVPQPSLPSSGPRGGFSGGEFGAAQIVCLVLAVCMFGCYLIVIVNLFKTDQTAAGIVCLVLFCIPLVAFIYGWKNAADWGIVGVMLAWTAMWLTYIIVVVAVNVAASPAF
jgi:hypothetical protein